MDDKKIFYCGWMKLEYLPDCMANHSIVFEMYSNKYVLSDSFYEKLVNIEPCVKPDFFRPRDIYNQTGTTSAENERYYWGLGNICQWVFCWENWKFWK